MPWSTDDIHEGGVTDYIHGEGRIGPDGPWQALEVYVGRSLGSANTTYMWPSGSFMTTILLRDGGGNYTAVNASSYGGDAIPSSSYDSWYNPSMWYNSSSRMPPVYDRLYFSFLNVPLNASIQPLSHSEISFPNGRNYTPPVGILGLGPDVANKIPSAPSLLEQMKAKDTIASMFCGLHIGSALLNQRGSMILGGYEQNRVLGDVGTFDLPEVRGPRGFLLDVVLGVEIGASPFNQPGNISLWHGIHDDPSDSHRSESDGGRTGSRLIDINPSVPYMYLPPGICETAAQYLSVTWDAGLELYTWNTDDQSSRVIGSPAFMGIILADKQAKNITIKVPFQLLNLTLLPPIVDTPTQYFPCTYNNEGYPGYALGRAFLQAAFFGFEFENNLAYIAQAPGPNMEQSIIKTYQPNDASITPNPVGSFASSWASSWTVLESPSSPSSPSTSGRGISRNATAGVAVGSAFGALAIVAAAAIIWRRKKRTQQNVAAKRDTAAAPPLIGPSMDNNGQPLELCPWTEPSEAYGNAPPHEMVGPDRVYEAPCEPSHHELPLGRAL